MKIKTSIYVPYELDKVIEDMVREELFKNKSQAYIEAMRRYTQALAQIEAEQ